MRLRQISGYRLAENGPDTPRRSLFRRGLAVAVTAAVIGAGMGVVAPSAAQDDGNVGAFLNHLNSVRAANGLPALALVSDLSAVAQQHSQEMAAQGTIFHNPSLKTQVTNWQKVGENVGMGPSEASIDNLFDHSPPHYANEVDPAYTQVGIGSVTRSDGQIFVTLDFRRPMNAGSAPAAPAPSAPKKAATPKSTASVVAQQVSAATASQQAAADAAAAQNAAKVAAKAAADQQAAGLTTDLKASTDPVACALVFSAHVNSIGQAG